MHACGGVTPTAVAMALSAERSQNVSSLLYMSSLPPGRVHVSVLLRDCVHTCKDVAFVFQELVLEDEVKRKSQIIESVSQGVREGCGQASKTLLNPLFS